MKNNQKTKMDYESREEKLDDDALKKVMERLKNEEDEGYLTMREILRTSQKLAKTEYKQGGVLSIREYGIVINQPEPNETTEPEITIGILNSRDTDPFFYSKFSFVYIKEESGNYELVTREGLTSDFKENLEKELGKETVLKYGNRNVMTSLQTYIENKNKFNKALKKTLAPQEIKQKYKSLDEKLMGIRDILIFGEADCLDISHNIGKDVGVGTLKAVPLEKRKRYAKEFLNKGKEILLGLESLLEENSGVLAEANKYDSRKFIERVIEDNKNELDAMRNLYLLNEGSNQEDKRAVLKYCIVEKAAENEEAQVRGDINEAKRSLAFKVSPSLNLSPSDSVFKKVDSAIEKLEKKRSLWRQAGGKGLPPGFAKGLRFLTNLKEILRDRLNFTCTRGKNGNFKEEPVYDEKRIKTKINRIGDYIDIFKKESC